MHMPECSMGICAGVVIHTVNTLRYRMRSAMLCVLGIVLRNVADFGEVQYLRLVSLPRVPPYLNFQQLRKPAGIYIALFIVTVNKLSCIGELSQGLRVLTNSFVRWLLPPPPPHPLLFLSLACTLVCHLKRNRLLPSPSKQLFDGFLHFIFNYTEPLNSKYRVKSLLREELVPYPLKM